MSLHNRIRKLEVLNTGSTERMVISDDDRRRAAAELDDWQRQQAGRLAQAGHTDAGELLEAVRLLSARALAG